MKSNYSNIDPYTVLKDELIFDFALSIVFGIFIAILIVVGSIIVFGKFTTPDMVGEFNFENIHLFCYSLIPGVIAGIISFILLYFRYKEIKILLMNGIIVEGVINSIDSIENSKFLYINVKYTYLGKKYDRIKRNRDDRIRGLFKVGDIVEIILNPQNPKFFIFKDLYL